MSDNWMTHSFFPLLPLDPSEASSTSPTTAISSSTTAHSIPLSTSVKKTLTSEALPSIVKRQSPNSDSYQSVLSSSRVSAPPPVDTELIRNAAPVAPGMDHESEAGSVERTIFNKIIASGCIIKSQQRGDPDLSHSQLCDELDKFLRQSPGSFLTRYGKYLNSDDLLYFDSMPQRNDFDVNFILTRLRKTLEQSSKSRHKRIRNRRYECLQQLMTKSSYFSEDEMRRRNPLLYDFYISQYLSPEEKQTEETRNTDMTLSSMILNQMDQDKTAELLQRQRRSELEELSVSAAAISEERVLSKRKWKTLKPMELSSDLAVAEREKHMLKQEFLVAMQTNFLEGRDEDFDYSTIDNDDKYDSLDMRERDEQDSYFDEEEPLWCGEEECVDSNMELT